MIKRLQEAVVYSRHTDRAWACHGDCHICQRYLIYSEARHMVLNASA